MLSRNRVAQFTIIGLILALIMTACVRPLSNDGNEAGEEANENVNVAALVESSGDEIAGEADAEEQGAGEVVAEEATGEDAAESAGQATDSGEAAEAEAAETEVETTEEEPAATDENAGGGTPETAAEEAEAEQVEESTAEETTAEDASAEETAETTAEAETASEAQPELIAEKIHVVEAGENLYRIGLKYGVSWVVLAQHNNLPNANVIYVGQELSIPGDGPAPTEPDAPATETISYTVKSGDNLFRIGLRFGVSWVEIAEANGIVNPGQIFPGQVLKIPSSAPGPSPEFTHNVLGGETLYSIALRYGLQWLSVAEANDINSPYVIYAGQSLVIPGS